jgi:hypothetical protein
MWMDRWAWQNIFHAIERKKLHFSTDGTRKDTYHLTSSAHSDSDGTKLILACYAGGCLLECSTM